MRVLFLDPLPPQIVELLEQWQSWGDGNHWEMWDGTLHVNGWPEPTRPPEIVHRAGLARALLLTRLTELLNPLTDAAGLDFHGFGSNIGGPEDFRVADGVATREQQSGAWITSAALILEIISPGDDVWNKLPFYATRYIDELLILDPQKQTVGWFGLQHDAYAPIERSGLIELGPAELAAKLDWPPVEQ